MWEAFKTVGAHFFSISGGELLSGIILVLVFGLFLWYGEGSTARKIERDFPGTPDGTRRLNDAIRHFEEVNKLGCLSSGGISTLQKMIYLRARRLP